MQEVSRMRITRAYTITPEVKRILDTKPNKSEYICRAVKKLHTQEEEIYAYEFDTSKLVIALKNREELWPHLRRELEEYLRSIS